MAKGRTCGEIHESRCEIHPSQFCDIVIEHEVEETSEAILRAREVIEEMGHDWKHGPDSTHSCKLCSIERRNGFPTGYLNDRDRRRYWVKKHKKERRQGIEEAKRRGHVLPANHPFGKDRSITPKKEPKTKPRKPIKKKRSTSQSQRKNRKPKRKK